ncbi:hypothetical protein FACS1894217_04850 [Clostridia bacterium]|nr:hypothetical protein FACS1894217_04850 [Clostridia bacterium]
MTVTNLIDALKVTVETALDDLILEKRGSQTSRNAREPDSTCGVNAYKLRAPTEEAETEEVPYIIIQPLNGNDTQEAGQYPQADAKIRFVIATYSADNSTGALSVLTIIDRLRLAFERRGVIAEQYQLMPPLEWVIYPEDTAPYFLGEISTVWTIPAVQQEVNFNG